MSTRQTRNVSLTPELDQYIDDQLAAGEYGNASEVVRTAIKALRDQQARALPQGDGTAWLMGDSECARLTRAFDWSKTQLGPMSGWSPQLKATVSNVVNSPIPKVLMWGPEHVMLYNDGYRLIAGGYHPTALGGTVPGIWPEIWDFNRAILQAGFRGEVQSMLDQTLVLNRYGQPEDVVFDLFYTPVYEDHGVGGVLCTVIETTERVEMQRAVAHSEAEFRTITNALPILISYIDRDHIYRFANDYYEDWVGIPVDRIVGAHVRDVVGEAVFAAREPLMAQALAGRKVVADATMPHRDGRERTCEIHYLPRTESGETVGFHVLVFDVQDRVDREAALQRQIGHRTRAEEQLRQLNDTLEARVLQEIGERRRAEAVLLQTQKMETVGKLTGGVAHDFNNLLQVISGNLQLLQRDVTGNDKAERRVANAMAGVARGSKLAAQLLAFGRRQALEPKVVNPTRMVRDMDDMLRRAIGEGIEIETVVAGGLWNSFIDPAQLENALLNLAINARDAMDGTGKLTIELGNASLDDDYARSHGEVTPGQYVMLAVSDTGCGMAPDLIDKVFEPFFSTKGEGKGSGLGLSMVYGFVKQSGGHVKIYSEVDEGTTIKLYLPRSLAAEDVEVAVDTGPISGGSETILVVEDDDAVRATVVEMLSDLGYRVLKAVDAGNALSVVESGIPIDILFTDVVMPGRLKSPELARMARERLPNIAVLFTSGYTENSIVHGGKLDAGIELLSKPYSREALARRLRHVLANQRQREVAAAPAAPRVESLVPPAKSGPVVVLLVEDDELIRASTSDMLQQQGYLVIDAPTAEDALVALHTSGVDVLVTDVNLPTMSGPELAAQAAEIRPRIGVVYATGDAQVPAAEGDPHATILTKPYSAASLAEAVARVGQAAVAQPADTRRPELADD
ncbi:type II toxin-antitoxin system ParD family antitoxin [Sphingomonas naphthae]|uniref:histidine kinase n=1 Tax=Sphingomonas naphthae TaxID=1813468 RepID=A0ABY7TRN4_9SPHN|nr:type II toxin-antitoxin system ParD family antitoxin [Sphingomonas naphthae]WCT75312.1 type II toxin-antitoxin system ParD family antitoxin [Sphingomonas naphthae]